MDPYKTLGVAKDATPEQIRAAYRKLAKKLHPDLNPGDKTAEGKFKELNAANDLLSDADKRARFDRGEIDATGAEKPQQHYYKDFAGAGGPETGAYRSTAGFADFGDAGDIFADLFGGGRAGMGGHGNFRMRGSDVHYRLEVDFLDAINGATRQVTLADGKPIDVAIPAGLRDGQALRLKGKGEPGPHAFFVRDGDDVRLDLPISLREAVLGGKVAVPTPTGAVMASVPKWSSSGKVLRLKGRGVPKRDGGKGDLYVTLKLVLPEQPDAALEKAIAELPATAEDPRAAMGV